MVSAVFILHWPDLDIPYSRCELLLHRYYYNDFSDPHAVVHRFSRLYSKLQPSERTPFVFDSNITYIMFRGENDIYLMAAANANVNAMSIMTFLHQLHDILVRYFESPTKKQDSEGQNAQHVEGDPGLTREKIIDNHALVFELLDECMDFGIVQLTDYNILKEYIKTKRNTPTTSLHSDDSSIESDSDSESKPAKKKASTKSDKKKKIANKKLKSTHNLANKTDILNETQEQFINSSLVRTQASAISWRPKGIFYAKNEIYIDIVEKCHFLYDLESNTVKGNDISGVCEVRSYLSGMPVCKLGLNEKYISQVEYDGESESTSSDEDEDASPTPSEVKNNLIKSSDSLDNDDASQTPDNNHKKEKRLKVPITNVSFHQCIELSSVYKKNLIHFTPPDDRFTLFSYNAAQQRRKEKKPLIMVEPLFKIIKAEGKLQVLCSLTTSFKKRLHCKPLVVRIPISPNLFHLDGKQHGSLRYKAELGDASFEVDSSTLTWTIPDLPGSKMIIRFMAELTIENADQIDEASINASFYQASKTSNDQDEESASEQLSKYYGVDGKSSTVFDELQRHAMASQNREIHVEFSIPLLTYSGLRITYLSVEEIQLKYSCFPWVRYLTEVRNKALSQTRSGRTSEYRFRLAPRCFQIL